ncbi:MAG TPA: peptide ABC transporter substrate-binding protein [Ktedonobacteraceae bacterium]|nr:peptide ABC transporter substrate-binding protein [Ktedonobacteraceae bacterium]
MRNQSFLRRPRRYGFAFLIFSALLLVVTACGGGNPAVPGTSTLAIRQVLSFPNVGTQDISVLDPAQGADSNSALVVGMIYSGLVRFDKNLNVIPDQATWSISPDRKVYTFSLKPGVTFSDGTPVTAQTYVYTLTRALLPAVKSPIASFFLANIAGALDLNNGKTTTLSGVKALNPTTLQITLTRPADYFLQIMAGSVTFALNQKIIEQYGQTDWVNHAAGGALGTGPFMIKEWDHGTKMILVPNPHYYGAKTKLSEVDMFFVDNPGTAFKSYRAHQYDLAWNIVASDLPIARTQPGYVKQSLLETDMLFFDNRKPPFNNSAVRQAFAYAINRDVLVKSIFDNAVVAAPTIIPPGMPGYQPGYPGLAYDASRAKTLLQSVYPDVSKVPPITFSFPSSQVSSTLSQALQQMWQTALGIQVKLQPVELGAYNNATAAHQIQFGFTQWGADFPDPYDWLALNLTSTAPNNNGEWNNPGFDATIAQAENSSGQARIALYNQAERIAINDVGWLPIDHQAMSAIIPSYVHGISLNSGGLFFDDWSNVYILQH